MGRITENRADVYQEITDQMIAMIEAGTRPWSKSWNGSAAPNIPLRSTGVAYRGINVLTLWVASMTKGFASPHWLTFKQALALGGCVRKGEKGSTVVYANKIVVGDGKGGEQGEDGKRQVAFLKRYTVFNAEQIDGIDAQYPMPEPIITATNPHDRDAELDSLFGRVPVTVRHHGSQPYYQPSGDDVVMPEFSDFHTSDDYYSTLSHELCHASGHKDRLARPTLISTKREDYAREELVVRRVGANKGVKTCLLDSWENPCVPDLPVPVMNRLKSRKRNGTIACREKAQTAETIVGRAGHRKVRTAKATLPELQSSGFYPRQRRSDGCSVAPRRNRDATRPGMKRVVRSNTLGPASAACPSSMGSKGRTERLTASHLLVRVNTGSPKWALQRPTWRQSRHSSQMPGVMPRTAIFGWTITDESCRATGAGLLTGRVKGGSACETGQPTGWAC